MIARSSLACCLLVACGGGAPAGVDARGLDAPPDTLGTSSGDPPPNAVAIAVTGLGDIAPEARLGRRVEPLADVPVYFQNADSTVVLATKTDAKGVAWANLADGGYVTAIEPANATGATPITTFAAVKAGDRLHLALQPIDPAQPVTVTLSVPVPADPAVAGFDVHNSCGDIVGLPASGTGQVTFYDCGNGAIDLVVVPHDGNGDHGFGALFASAVPIVDGGSAPLSGIYASFTALPFTYRNIPSQISWLGTYRAIVSPRGRAYDVSIGDPVSPSTVTDSVLVPPVPLDTLVLTATDEVPVATELGEQIVYDWRTIGTPHDLDLAASRVPPFVAPPAYSQTMHGVMWSERNGGTAANFVRLTLHANRADIPNDHTWSWRIAAPKLGAMVAFPVLPNDGFDFNPATGDVTTVDGLTTAALSAGFDAIRGNAFDDLLTSAPVSPGTMVVQTQFSPNL